MKRTLLLATMIAIGSAAFIPTQAMAQIDLNIIIGNAPPPARFESVPPPRRGEVWAPGYWNWEGNRHTWASGHWEPERNGQHYRRAEWQRVNDGWRLNRGGWQAVQAQPVDVQYVRVAPPALRYERTPRPRQGYVWASGHWEWRGQNHGWVPGIWIAERPGYNYTQASWAQRDGRWYMEQSRWAPRRGYGDNDRDGIPNRYDRDRNNDGIADRNDRDRDGIPNRYDRDRDNDGIRNRNDRDRDGDGTPNRHDSRPDNPRRD